MAARELDKDTTELIETVFFIRALCMINFFPLSQAGQTHEGLWYFNSKTTIIS